MAVDVVAVAALFDAQRWVEKGNIEEIISHRVKEWIELLSEKGKE